MPGYSHSLFRIVKRGNLNGKQAGRLDFVQDLCGVRSVCFRVFHDLTIADCSPYIFKIFCCLCFKQGYAHIPRGLFNKESKRQNLIDRNRRDRSNFVLYGAGFGCLFRGSLPCLIPFAVPRAFFTPPLDDNISINGLGIKGLIMTAKNAISARYRCMLSNQIILSQII